MRCPGDDADVHTVRSDAVPLKLIGKTLTVPTEVVPGAEEPPLGQNTRCDAFKLLKPPRAARETPARTDFIFLSPEVGSTRRAETPLPTRPL